MGLGSSVGELLFNEYTHSNSNSFSNIHINDPSSLKKQTLVKTSTVDQFTEENGIQKIDVLKIDTEGFEGAKNLFSDCKIGLLFFEVSFLNSHKDTPTFTELWGFVTNNDFELVSIYPLIHRKKMGLYTNILFKHKSY
jgi:hypothetical protein